MSEITLHVPVINLPIDQKSIKENVALVKQKQDAAHEYINELQKLVDAMRLWCKHPVTQTGQDCPVCGKYFPPPDPYDR